MQDDHDQLSQLSRLREVERRHDLFAFKVDGWSAWRVLRNPMQRQAEAWPLVEPVRANTSRVIAAIVGSLRLLKLLIAGDQRELLVKTCRSGMRMQVGQKYRDVYFDGLLATGVSYRKIEEINSPDFGRQAAAACFPADLDSVVFTFWGMLLGRLLPVNLARAYCDEVAKLLEQEVGLSVAPSWLLSRVSTAYWQSRIYGLLLRSQRPRAVLVSDTGEYGLNIACKRLNVTFVELQHGVFDATHPDAIPDWVFGTPAELLLPDYLACRGDFWIDQLSRTRQGKGHAKAVGDEMIDLALLSRSRYISSPRIRLVLSSQGLDSSRLADWIESMAAQAPKNLDWEIVIKLHPRYNEDDSCFDKLGRYERIRIVQGAEEPDVFELIATADLHLSIASFCHFDAAALNIPTVVIPLAGHEAVSGAVDGQHIHIAREPADVWVIATTGSKPDPAFSRRIVKPGFVGNLARLLTESGTSNERSK